MAELTPSELTAIVELLNAIEKDIAWPIQTFINIIILMGNQQEDQDL